MTSQEQLLKVIDTIYANRNNQLLSDNEAFNFLTNHQLNKILDHLENKELIKFGERIKTSAKTIESTYKLEQIVEQEPQEERIKIVGFGNNNS